MIARSIADFPVTVLVRRIAVAVAVTDVAVAVEISRVAVAVAVTDIAVAVAVSMAGKYQHSDWIAQQTIRLRRGVLTVEPSVEIAIEGSDISVAIVAAVADSDVSDSIEIAIEGTDIAVAVTGAPVEIAVSGTDIVVATR